MTPQHGHHLTTTTTILSLSTLLPLLLCFIILLSTTQSQTINTTPLPTQFNCIAQMKPDDYIPITIRVPSTNVIWPTVTQDSLPKDDNAGHDDIHKIKVLSNFWRVAESMKQLYNLNVRLTLAPPVYVPSVLIVK